MKDGDIDNGIPLRVLVIWEKGYADLISPRIEATALRLRRWHVAADCWQTNGHMLDRIWDLWRRYDLRADVVITDRPLPFSRVITQRLEDADSPIRHVLNIPVEKLGRSLIRMPDVHAVLHRDPQLQFAFGSRGRLVEFGKALAL